jgi:hypothetical protein
VTTDAWKPAPAVKQISANPLAFLDTAKPLPEHIAPNINPGLWARSLILNDTYREPRPGAMSTVALVNALNDEDLFAQPEDSGVIKIGDYLANEPMASTPDLEAHDIYVYPSDGKDGAPCYVDVNVIQLDAGADFILRIGSRRVQAFYLKALAAGAWPVRHRITRTSTKVKDTYTYSVMPPRV